MRAIILALFWVVATALQAQEVERITLAKDATDEAILHIYKPAGKAERTPAVLICPGGGYRGLALDREGHDMAKWYASNGILAAVLEYRMPQGRNEVPLSDAEKAIALMRANGERWKIDTGKVGVVGSSAGGHLAASLSTLAADENRPDFAILYYPVISLEDDLAHQGSKHNLLGEKAGDAEMVRHYSLQYQVDDKTPRTLLLLSDDDKVVPPMNSIRYYSALKEHGIPASLYLFPKGGHGWGIKYDFAYYQEVKELILKWLAQAEIWTR